MVIQQFQKMTLVCKLTAALGQWWIKKFVDLRQRFDGATLTEVTI